jgi:hypothetical protein
VEFALDGKNIFDTRTYRYAATGSLNDIYNTYELRPASVLVKVSVAL